MRRIFRAVLWAYAFIRQTIARFRFKRTIKRLRSEIGNTLLPALRTLVSELGGYEGLVDKAAREMEADDYEQTYL